MDGSVSEREVSLGWPKDYISALVARLLVGLAVFSTFASTDARSAGGRDAANRRCARCKSYGRQPAEIPAEAGTTNAFALDFAVFVVQPLGGGVHGENCWFVHSKYLPNRILMLSQCSKGGAIEQIQPFLGTLTAIDGVATAYVCEDHVCALPASAPDVLAEVLGVGL